MVNKEHSENLDMTRIHIVGTLQLQNELFSQALAKATGLPCTCASHENLPNLIEENSGGKSIILWDCVDAGDEAIWSEMNPNLPRNDYLFILFNVLPERNIETLAVKHGVRGIFYRGDSFSVYKKGIQTILKGQRWFSRMVLEKCLLEFETGTSTKESAGEQALLTFREQQILSMIATGLRKDDIADSLNISPHTVKTHTHNIYKKINVTSRIKASLWATRNHMYLKNKPAEKILRMI
jgi:LuxR family transcriptional regulator of csgAB operon